MYTPNQDCACPGSCWNYEPDSSLRLERSGPDPVAVQRRRGSTVLLRVTMISSWPPGHELLADDVQPTQGDARQRQIESYYSRQASLQRGL